MKYQLLTVAIIVFALFIGGCGKENSDPKIDSVVTAPVSQEIQRIAKSYSELILMTPQPVLVNPEFMMLCGVLHKEVVDAARIEKGPHANCSVKIYMNDLASNAFSKKEPYPVGAIVVKEKNMLGYRILTDNELHGTGSGVGGMIKRKSGFDEENGNWEYFYFENASSIESGKMKTCIDCHSKARTSDYVFGDWAKQENDESYGY